MIMVPGRARAGRLGRRRRVTGYDYYFKLNRHLPVKLRAAAAGLSSGGQPTGESESLALWQ